MKEWFIGVVMVLLGVILMVRIVTLARGWCDSNIIDRTMWERLIRRAMLRGIIGLGLLQGLLMI